MNIMSIPNSVRTYNLDSHLPCTHWLRKAVFMTVLSLKDVNKINTVSFEYFFILNRPVFNLFQYVFSKDFTSLLHL